MIYQGQTPVESLTALQKDVLSFLVKNPHRQHTKTDIIVNTWPEELREQGVSDDALYQVIVTLRRNIEPDSSNPRYLITWRGRPEGGYQFFPEGKPG
jgi:DNA-binding response OmpR family regulator